jgi:hypothetical protein
MSPSPDDPFPLPFPSLPHVITESLPSINETVREAPRAVSIDLEKSSNRPRVAEPASSHLAQEMHTMPSTWAGRIVIPATERDESDHRLAEPVLSGPLEVKAECVSTKCDADIVKSIDKFLTGEEELNLNPAYEPWKQPFWPDMAKNHKNSIFMKLKPTDQTSSTAYSELFNYLNKMALSEVYVTIDLPLKKRLTLYRIYILPSKASEKTNSYYKFSGTEFARLDNSILLMFIPNKQLIRHDPVAVTSTSEKIAKLHDLEKKQDKSNVTEPNLAVTDEAANRTDAVNNKRARATSPARDPRKARRLLNVHSETQTNLNNEINTCNAAVIATTSTEASSLLPPQPSITSNQGDEAVGVESVQPGTSSSSAFYDKCSIFSKKVDAMLSVNYPQVGTLKPCFESQQIQNREIATEALYFTNIHKTPVVPVTPLTDSTKATVSVDNEHSSFVQSKTVTNSNDCFDKTVEETHSNEPQQVEIPATVLENPATVLENPETVLENPETVLENPETVLENPETAIEESEPAIKDQIGNNESDIQHNSMTESENCRNDHLASRQEEENCPIQDPSIEFISDSEDDSDYEDARYSSSNSLVSEEQNATLFSAEMDFVTDDEDETEHVLNSTREDIHQETTLNASALPRPTFMDTDPVSDVDDDEEESIKNSSSSNAASMVQQEPDSRPCHQEAVQQEANVLELVNKQVVDVIAVESDKAVEIVNSGNDLTSPHNVSADSSLSSVELGELSTSSLEKSFLDRRLSGETVLKGSCLKHTAARSRSRSRSRSARSRSPSRSARSRSARSRSARSRLARSRSARSRSARSRSARSRSPNNRRPNRFGRYENLNEFKRHQSYHAQNLQKYNTSKNPRYNRPGDKFTHVFDYNDKNYRRNNSSQYSKNINKSFKGKRGGKLYSPCKPKKHYTRF